MESAENNFPGEDTSESLEAEVASLRQQVWTLLVLLLVVSGTLSIFLMRQVTYARSDLAAMKAQVTPFMQEYQKELPGLDQFQQKMNEYGRAHPDFVPLLTKYNAVIPANSAAPKK